MQRKTYIISIRLNLKEFEKLIHDSFENNFTLKNGKDKPDIANYVRFKLFYDNPVFQAKFMATLERLFLDKEYYRAARFFDSIKGGKR